MLVTVGRYIDSRNPVVVFSVIWGMIWIPWVRGWGDRGGWDGAVIQIQYENKFATILFIFLNKGTVGL